jgi:DNA primase
MAALELENIDVLHMLESLDIENVTEATMEEVRFSCPFPDDHTNADEKPSCYMNVDTTAFYCHGCHARGNAVHFVERCLGITPLEATRLLKEKYQPGAINPDSRDTVREVKKIIESPTEEKIKQPIIPENATSLFEVDWFAAYEAFKKGEGHPGTDYILKRGFTPETLTEWEFGWDQITRRVSFAVRDEKNNLVGFKGRSPWPDVDAKYLVLGDRPGKPKKYGWDCYHTGQVVFGLPKALELADPNRQDMSRHIVVCEGELNAVALWQMGIPAVAINGSNLTHHQSLILRQEADIITCFFDSDRAGFDAEEAVMESLTPFIPVKLVPEHEGDPAEMKPEKVTELLDDALGTTYLAATYQKTAKMSIPTGKHGNN